jgi:hypothetical protein
MGDVSDIIDKSTLKILRSITYNLFSIHKIGFNTIDGAYYTVYARSNNSTPNLIRFYINTDPVILYKDDITSDL